MFCVYMGPLPNESWVSLNADSGVYVTNFHFNVSGSSGGGRRYAMKGTVVIMNDASEWISISAVGSSASN